MFGGRNRRDFIVRAIDLAGVESGRFQTVIGCLAGRSGAVGSGVRSNRAVRYALLGMISRHPGGIHGYALKRICDRVLGHSWQLNFSEVYRVLDSLQNEGLLEEVGNGTSARRKVVRVTEEGRCTLSAFLSDAPTDLDQPRRQELAVKILFAQPERLPDLVQAIDRHRDACMDDLHLLAVQRRKLRRGPVDPFVGNILIDGVERIVRAQIAWLDDVSKKLQGRFEAPS